MAPKFMADRRVGTTHYQSHYDGNKVSKVDKTSKVSKNIHT